MIVHIIIFQSLRRLLCVSNQLCITSRAKIDPKIEIIYARREILTRRKMLKLNHNHSMFTPPLCFPANYPNSRFCHQGMGIKLIKRFWLRFGGRISGQNHQLEFRAKLKSITLSVKSRFNWYIMIKLLPKTLITEYDQTSFFFFVSEMKTLIH